jgi:DNA-binding PadR family transcriptional regulator
MKFPQSSLTEQAGAIMRIVETTPDCTPYKVLVAFKNARSTYWSSSTGSVYSVIGKLEKAGHVELSEIVANPRQAKAIRLTKKGRVALEDWVLDTATAVATGYDPFRLRLPVLARLTRERRGGAIQEWIAALEEQRASLEKAIRSLTVSQSHEPEMTLMLVNTRIDWLKKTYPDEI